MNTPSRINFSIVTPNKRKLNIALAWSPLWATLLVSILGSFQWTQAAEDLCREATSLVDSRFSESEKSHWFKALESCGAGNGQSLLASITATIQERSRAESQLGDAMSRAGDFKSGLRHYEAALTWTPLNQQVAKNLTLTRAQYGRYIADQIDDLISTGKLDEAVKLLNEPDLRSLGPLATSPAWGRLRHLLSDRMIAEATVGHYDQAVDDLKLALEDSPRKTFFEVSDGNLWVLWATLRAILFANAEAIALALVFFWLLMRLVRRYYERPVLELRDFDNNKMSPGIEQAIQAMFINLSSARATSTSTALQVTRPLSSVPPAVDISNVLPASVSWVKVIPGLIAWVLPRRTLAISGVLHDDPVWGAGVTIHLVTRDGVHWSETFWAKHYGIQRPAAADKTPAHYGLAEYVAIWLLYKTANSAFSLSKRKPFDILGATNWRSYAFFRAAVNAEPDLNLAKSLYLSALSDDEHLHAARLNLAMLATTKERPFTFDLFRCAAEKAVSADATRYQARYSLASLRYDMEGADAAIEEMAILYADLGSTCVSYQLGEDLVQKVSELYKELKGIPLDIKKLAPAVGQVARRRISFKRQSYAELKQYIGVLLPIARAMSLGLLISKDHSNKRALSEIAKIARDDQSPRVRYNLSCAYSLVAEGLAASPAPDTALLRSHLAKGLSSLALALWLSPGIGRKARDDRALKALRTSQATVNGEAVSIGFERIVASYVDAPAPAASLSDFASIGSTGAQLLAAADIRSVSDLVSQSLTKLNQEKLAHQIKVGCQQVREWASTAELTRIPGLQPHHANLLNRARITSISDLAIQTTPDLCQRLRDWAISLQSIAPSDALVDSWIVASKLAVSVVA